ncbi:hypothetical protein OPIT5_23330 [Opitutaceae bacterium TAV5]|nr:hypothetical protein OPIT5_23330 [Opitutaceae bacterium TAV5]
MNIDTHLDVIKACRFCFMCRHLATTANVTFREADIPRGIALLLDRVRMNPTMLGNPDFIRTLYDNTLSAACRKHCVSHYDEAGLVLAARRDIVEQNLAPAEIRSLADEISAAFSPKLAGGGGRLLYLRVSSEKDEDAPVAAAFATIAAKAGIDKPGVLRTNDTGKALSVLGFSKQAAALATRLAALVTESGCDTLVVSCPAAFDALKNDYTAWSVPWPKALRILHASVWLAELAEKKTLTPRADATAAPSCAYIDSDYLRNYNGIDQAPRDLLRAFGYASKPFGTNSEESFALGEGAVVFDRIRSNITRLLRKRLEAHMDSPGDVIITASPYTRRVLADATDGRAIPVLSIEEAIAARI